MGRILLSRNMFPCDVLAGLSRQTWLAQTNSRDMTTTRSMNCIGVKRSWRGCNQCMLHQLQNARGHESRGPKNQTCLKSIKGREVALYSHVLLVVCQPVSWTCLPELIGRMDPRNWPWLEPSGAWLCWQLSQLEPTIRADTWSNLLNKTHYDALLEIALTLHLHPSLASARSPTSRAGTSISTCWSSRLSDAGTGHGTWR